MTFKLGKSSMAELVGVDARLVEIVKLAITTTTQDFTVFDGLRTAADQRALYNRGASQIDGYSKIGKHQAQSNGFGHAVDLVPWINGQAVWDWDAIYEIADAVVAAAKELDTPLRWGGCWGHTSVTEMSGSPENWVAAYVKRKRAAGKRAFNDGPHWELM